MSKHLIKKNLVPSARYVCPEDVLFDNFRNDTSAQIITAFEKKGVTYQDLLDFAKEVPIIYPWDPYYDKYRYNVNRRFVVFPWGIVMAETTEHVKKAINWVRKYKIPMVTRSGSHCYEPFSLVNGIIIDQSRRTDMRLLDNNTVVVESGVLIGPLQKFLSERGLAFVGGTCPNVGVAGLSLGGGIGFLCRKFGLATDNLIAAEVVLASGEVVSTNEKHNPDLFWALRGGGNGNFGIVTKFAFRVYPITQVTLFSLRFQQDQTKEVIDLWQRWAPFTINEITSELDVFNDHINFAGVFLGSEDILKKILKPFLKLEPQQVEINEIDFIDSVRHFSGMGFYPPFFKNKSGFVKKFLPEKALDIIQREMKLADPGVKLELFSFGGHVKEVTRQETAFVHREDTLYWFQIQNHWERQSQNGDQIEWTENFYLKLEKYFSGAYINCADSELEDPLVKYYGSNLPKLLKLKQKYDPADLFYYPQGLH